MSKRKVALDSCAILHLLWETPQWYPHVRVIYDDAVAGNIVIVVSEISVAEVSRLEVQGGKVLTPEEQARIISQFFHQPFIERRTVTSRESVFAASLIRKYDVGTCDAVIAATAALAGAGTLYTTDGCTKRRKPGKLLTVSEIVTDDGKRMKVEPPDAAKYAAASQGSP
jgi:predicted nucleic acid-binding protein